MAARTRNIRRTGFSLAELMIAIVILGLGLLFIAAALPVGIDYSRRNVERAEAEAAARQALDTLEIALRTSTAHDPTALRLGYPVGTYGPASSVFRPRFDVDGNTDLEAIDNYEPIIKVRPLVMRNIQGRNAAAAGTSRIGHHVIDRAEDVIRNYLDQNLALPFLMTPPGGGFDLLEADLSPGFGLSLASNPALPATARFFPMPTSVNRIYPEDYQPLNLAGFRNGIYPQYTEPDNALPGVTDPAGAAGVAPEDLLKLFDRRISWTAFYRRVEYNKYQYTPGTGPANVFGSVASDGSDPAPLYPVPPAIGDTLERAADPLLYEIIVVVTRRPSENHFFAHQDLTFGGSNRFAAPRAAEPGDNGLGDSPLLQIGEDRLAPMPWLVTFDGLPNLPASPGAGPPYLLTNGGEDRSLSFGIADRPTLEFRCSPRLGDILPVGSILIPARNDYRPTALLGNQADWAGFVPSAPDELPIYRVVDRPSDTVVLVENNGFYPWLSGAAAGVSIGGVTPRVILDTNGEFPFWVIPPSFEDRLQDGTPLFERRSPILKVARRLIRLPEVR